MPLSPTLSAPEVPLYDGKQVVKASLVAVRLEARRNGVTFGSASGFIDIGADGLMLVTNRHVVTGRDHFTGKILDERYAQLPDELVVWYRQQNTYELVPGSVPLFDDALWPLWREHPELKERADVVAIPVVPPPETLYFPRAGYIDEEMPDFRLLPMDAVAVVGFPFGKHASGFPVWTTGSIASEPDFPYDNLPVFLIDARTRKSQSGSLVIFQTNTGLLRGPNGELRSWYNAPHTLFLGIYSGRINAESDIGMVWRAEIVTTVLEKGILSGAMDPDQLREATTR